LEEELKEVRTSTALIQFGGDEVFRVTFTRNSTINIDALKENQEAFASLAGDKTYPFIFAAEDNVRITPDAQQHAVTMGPANMLVIAVVVNNFLYRLIAEFYYGRNKPAVPYKVFSNADEAESWIKLYS
jgi:hypothetical protein